MSLTKQDIRDCVVESVREMLTDNANTPITDQTDPVVHLGLDSLDGVLIAATICDKLKFNIPTNLNPFVDDGPPPRVRCVGEIVTCLFQILVRQQEKSHA
ncbi:MAG: hypothetical protein HUU46_07720 [Candidatus Hydrogenedentes bacterium]|nr:hypothetical protein [Candidatus Hydrogenedentota bacterium]